MLILTEIVQFFSKGDGGTVIVMIQILMDCTLLVIIRHLQMESSGALGMGIIIH